MSKAEEILRWYDQLKAERYNFDNIWQDIKDYVKPYAGDITTRRVPGEKMTTKIFDSTAAYGGHVFSQFVQGALVNPGNKWFGFRHADVKYADEPEVMTRLEEIRDQILSVMRSGFYGPAGQAINGWTFFGNGPLLVEEVPQKRTNLNRIRWTAIPAGQFVMAEGEDGKIDKFIRCLRLPAHIAVSLGDVSEDLKTAAKKDPLKKFEILHSIMPRDMQAYSGDYKKSKVQTSKDMPYASCWVEKEKKKLIKESGYRKFPVAVARYDLISGETYGRGPAELALPDARSLNQADQKALLKWDRELDPPTLTRRNSIIGGILNKRAGGNTLVNGEPRNSIVPLFEGSNWQAHDTMAERKEQAILRVFHVSEILGLLMREKPEMTAFEWNGRLQLLQQIIGPVFNRLEIEWLSLVIDLTLDILLFNNLLGDIPDILGEGKDVLNVIYEGPLAKAQRNGEILDIQQYTADVAGIAQFHQESLLKIDWDKVIDRLAVLRGTQEFLVPEQDYTNQVNQARQQANTEKMLQVAAGTGEALGKVAPFVKATREDVGSGRAAA